MKRALVPAAVLAATVAAFGMPAQSGHDLFQQALVKERAEGNLQEAIDLYDRIVRDFPEDHALAAKALVQMGQCYEKLGQGGAKKAYERVIRDYADQAEPLQVARARLAALTQPPRHEMTVRRVWSDPMADVLGEISPDGRHLSVVDQQTGDLSVRNLRTDESRRLTGNGPSKDALEFALYSRWSPDGTQIAYDWWHPNAGCNELRVVALEDGRSRVLHKPDEDTCVLTADWSPDGREILVILASDSRQLLRLAAVSVMDGRVRTITQVDKRYPWGTAAGFSPDGRFVFYSHRGDEGNPTGDVFVLSVDGRGKARLVDHPANDMAAGWSPDGRWVLFVSDRTGTLDLWMLPVSEGRPAGEPRLVKSGTGRITPMGFDSSGRFYYGTSPASQDVYTARLDPRTSRALTPPAKAIRRFEGSNDWPSFSADGKRLAYVTARGSMGLDRSSLNVLCIVSLDTGEEREFPSELPRLADARFSPDGTAVFVVAWEDGGRMGLYRVDIRSGETSLVVQASEGSSFSGFAVSPDGKSVIYARCDDADGICRILRRGLATGSETEIYRGPNEPPTIALAPDGWTLAFLTRNTRESENTERIVRVVPATGGPSREVYRFTASANRWIPLEFSADGKHLYMPWNATWPDNPLWDLRRLPVGGGEPQDLGLKMAGFRRITSHPDGEQIAFSSRGVKHKDTEVWVLEDFLPRATGRP